MYLNIFFFITYIMDTDNIGITDNIGNRDNIGITDNIGNRDIETNLTNSYMDFVENTNTSLHNMLSIINSQQNTYNQLLRQYNLTAHPIQPYQPIGRIPEVIFPRYSPLVNRNRRSDSLRRSPINRSRTNTHRTANRHVLFNTFNLHDYFPHASQISSRPTQAQIEDAIDRKYFHEIENPLNNSCPISHSDFSGNDYVIQLRGCNHIFSPMSILRWFERHFECPLCRHDIRNTTGETGEPDTGQSESREGSNETDENETGEDERENLQRNVPLPFAQQLASIISNQIARNRDFSGNISIELDIEPGLI